MKSFIRSLVAGVAVTAVVAALVLAGSTAAEAVQNPSPACTTANSDPFSLNKCGIQISDPTITSAQFGQPTYPGFAWTIGSGWDRTPSTLINQDRRVSLYVDWGDGTAPTVVTNMLLDDSVAAGTGWYCNSVGNKNSCRSMSHSYATPGTYTVTYTARLHLVPAALNYFVESTTQTNVVIASASPQVAWITKPAATATTTQTVTAAWSVGNVLASKPYSSVIDWGDGTIETVATLETLPKNFTASHVYAVPGSYLPFIRAYPTGTSNLDMTQSQASVVVTLDSASAPQVILVPPGSCDANLNCVLGDEREIKPNGSPVVVNGYMSDISTGVDPFTVVVDWGDGSTQTFTTPCTAADTWCSLVNTPPNLLVAPLPAGFMSFNFSHAYAERIPRTIVVSVSDKNGLSGAASGPATVTMTPQTITVNALADQTYPGTDQTVVAQASSGLPLTYLALGSCTVSEGVVHVTAAGTCSIQASQPGDGYFTAAETVTQSFDIAKADQNIFLSRVLFPVYLGPDLPISTYAGSEVILTLEGACTLVGRSLHPTAVGKCSITARAPGDAKYNAAADVTIDVWVEKAAQTLSFVLPATAVAGTLVPLTASASSGLPVSYAVTGPCALEAGSLRASSAGTCVVSAKQTGNADYQPAADLSQTITVSVGAKVQLSALPKTVVKATGIPVLAAVKVTTTSGKPAGTVTIEANGAKVATVSLVRGIGIAVIPASKLAKGSVLLTATYVPSGVGQTPTTSAPVTLTVR